MTDAPRCYAFLRRDRRGTYTCCRCGASTLEPKAHAIWHAANRDTYDPRGAIRIGTNLEVRVVTWEQDGRPKFEAYTREV